MGNKRCQVWIETVIYTLIGLALIGLVLAIATPRINESRDRILVEQTIDSLSGFDEKISEALDRGQGNIRAVEFSIRQGELYINSSSDKIVFLISDLSGLYSEPGIQIEYGRVTLVSQENQKSSSTFLTLDYSGIFNLTYNGRDGLKKFSAAATPYKFLIKNLGDVNTTDNSSLFVLDLEETSGLI